MSKHCQYACKLCDLIKLSDRDFKVLSTTVKLILDGSRWIRLSHLDSVTVDDSKDEGEEDHCGDADSHDDDDDEGGPGQGVRLHHGFQEGEGADSAAVTLGVTGVGEDRLAVAG